LSYIVPLVLTLWVASIVGQRHFTILMGYEADQVGFHFQTYFPSKVNVTVGDRITFVLNTWMPHSVVFGPNTFTTPWDASGKLDKFATTLGGTEINQTTFTTGVSSGLMGLPDDTTNGEWTVIFTQVGIFNFYDLLHRQAMLGTINVLPVSQINNTASPAVIENLAMSQINAKVAKIPTWIVQNNLNTTTLIQLTPTTYKLRVGWGSVADSVTYSRYIPSVFTVNVGDSITFENGDVNGPHTLTFEPEDEFEYPYGLINGTYFLNPRYLQTSTQFNGQFFNSGLLLPNSNPVTFKFTAAGSYNFTCVFDFDMFMSGSVTVKGVGAPTTKNPTTTGSGTTAAPSQTTTGASSQTTGQGTTANPSGSTTGDNTPRETTTGPATTPATTGGVLSSANAIVISWMLLVVLLAIVL